MTHPVPTLEDLATDFQEHHSEGSGADEPKSKTARPRLPGEELARRMLRKACPLALRRDLYRRRALVVIIEVPNAEWFDLIHDASRELFRSADFVLSDGVKKPKTRPLQEIALRTSVPVGRSLVAVCSGGLSELAPSILDAVDYLLKVELPNAAILAATLRAVFGNASVKNIPLSVGRESSAAALVAAIRRNESASRAVARLIELDRRNRSRAPMSLPEGPTLSELDGFGAAKDWGLELADDIEAYRRGDLDWSALSAAAILHGQPGTGKTYFAAALARSCRIPIFATSLGQIFGQTPGYLDSIIKGFDQVFSEARAKAPALIFIDELDALPDRATLQGRGRDWWPTVITHFLKLLDESRHGVVVLAATNMLGRVDTAILRAGRIERHFEIAPPGERELAAIMRHHLGPRLPDSDLLAVARMARGSTGAQGALIVKSAIAQARRQQRELSVDDLVRQVIHDDFSADELRRVCVHEAGHAIAAHALGRKVDHLSTIERGTTGGGVLTDGAGRIATRERLEEQCVIALAGRSAEILLLGDASSGSQRDLEIATGFICAIHGSLGLGESLSHRAASTHALSLMADQDFRRLVEEQLRILDTRCTAILTSHLPQLQAVAEALQAKRVMTGDEFLALVQP